MYNTDIDGKELKVGDRVMCINPDESLKLNEIYYVYETFRNTRIAYFKDLQGAIHGGYYSSRFKLCNYRKPHLPKFLL